jgi:D-psicose/D-tagatose/L-ribulose 3-epimerase
MKFGVNTMVWTTRITAAQEPLLSRIKEWGFNGVELFLSLDEPANIIETRKMLDRLGLECATCAVLPRSANLISADADVRARGVDFVTRCVERTQELGGHVMCGPLYAALGSMTGRRRTEEEWNWAVRGLGAVAHRSEALGVVLCIEPLNRFETYFLNTQADAAQLAHAIGSPNVKVHFDTFHANIEERDPVASLRSLGSDLGHVHISENDRGTPGMGHTNWSGIFSALKDLGYDGWVTIESFAQPEPELAAAAAIWRDLAPSGDELALSGLQFIKQMSRQAGILPN